MTKKEEKEASNVNESKGEEEDSVNGIQLMTNKTNDE